MSGVCPDLSFCHYRRPRAACRASKSWECLGMNCLVAIFADQVHVTVWHKRQSKVKYQNPRCSVLFLCPSLSRPMPDSQNVLILVTLAFVVAVSRAIICCNRSNPEAIPYPPGPEQKLIVGNRYDLPSTAPWITYTRWGKQYGIFVLRFRVDHTV
jgi:hypothetical protein